MPNAFFLPEEKVKAGLTGVGESYPGKFALDTCENFDGKKLDEKAVGKYVAKNFSGKKPLIHFAVIQGFNSKRTPGFWMAGG